MLTCDYKNSAEVNTLPDAVKIFLKMYHEEDIKKLSQDKNIQSLKIDYHELINHLENYGTKKKYDKLLLSKPDQVIKALNNALNKACKTKFLTVRIENMPLNINLKELKSQNLGSLISTTALIRNISDLKPKIKIAMFECMNCMALINRERDVYSEIEEPICNCGKKNVRLLRDESQFVDIRVLKLEEVLESRINGTTRDFEAYLEGDLADPLNNINPGDVVNIIGILKIVKNKKDGDKFIIDINNIIPIKSTYQDIEITEEDEEEILSLSKDPFIFKKITTSIAPSLSGHISIKEGLVLQQFGAYEGIKSDSITTRDFIHVLIIGDPGLAKSQLLKYISNLAPKGIYTAGAGSTDVGLTASAVNDKSTGNWSIDGGTLVLANGGIACIDELDKLDKKYILSLNEPMEQGTVSVSKAGIVQTLNARTSVLAAANPIDSKFYKNKTIREQIEIPDSTLSRFDLVFAVEDKINENKDRKLAYDMLDRNKHEKIQTIDQDTITKYIAYARKNYTPELTVEATDIIVDFYVNTRKAASYGDAKPVTPRDLEAIKRLSIARARVKLSDFVSKKHAQDAIRVYGNALRTVGLEPETAGDLSGSKSKNEIEYINSAETLIINKREIYGINIPKMAIEEIIQDIKTKCNVDRDRAYAIYYEALENLT